jgi:hypothetical protein
VLVLVVNQLPLLQLRLLAFALENASEISWLPVNFLLPSKLSQLPAFLFTVVHRFLSAVNVRPTISIVFHFLLVVQELKRIVPATVPSVLLPNMRAFPDVRGKFHAERPAPPPVFAVPPAPGAGEPTCGACLILLLAISIDQPKFHPVLLLLTSLILLHLLLSC